MNTLMKCSALLLGTVLWVRPTPGLCQLEPQPAERELEEPKAPVITKNPELLEPAQPDYPKEAQDQNIEGVVTIKIVLDASGFVEDASVEKGVHPLLDQAAIEAAYQLVFSPAEVDGQPSPIALLFSFTFEMAEPPPEVIEEIKKQPVVNFEGLVRQAGSKKPLELAEITVERILADGEKMDDAELLLAEAYTDRAGRFQIPDIPLGKHLVKIAISGHETFETIETFEEGKKTQLIAYLRPTETNLFETIVRKRRTLKEVSRITLSRDEVRKIPGTFGDPIRVLENLPGMAKLPLFGGALLIRGANPTDSGIYFDSVSIPVLYHFGGLTSVVNPEFLETIDFFPGGFGAKYGRAIAGIVDVNSRDLDFEDFQGSAEVDLIDSGFFLGGPIKLPGDKDLQIAFAARRSYIDALLPFVFDAINPGSESTVTAVPVYWDYQTKAELRLGAHRLSIFGFGSSDDLSIITNNANADVEADLGTSTIYHRIIGKVKSRLHQELSNSFQVYTGTNVQQFVVNASTGVNIDITGRRDTHGLRNALVYSPRKWFSWENGIDAALQIYRYRFDVPVFSSVGGFPRVEPPFNQESNQILENDGHGDALALYSEVTLGPIEDLTLIAGLRAERLAFMYKEERENDKEKFVEWFCLNPRFTLRFSPFDSTSFKGAFGIYNDVPAPQQLLPAVGQPDLELLRAFQWIGGFDHRFTDILNISLQWYFTKRDNLVQSSSKVTAEEDGTFTPEFLSNEGYGQSYGMELLFRHELTKYFFGWIAYTLSRSESDLSEEERYTVENTFDQTHILTLVAQTKLPWELTFGGRFRLVSGSPERLPYGSVHDLDTTDFQPISSRYIRPRKPAFHQLDLRIDRKFTFQAGSLTAYLDLLNVYNQQNVEFWQEDYRYRERAPVSGLPILPVIGLSGEF